MIINRKKSYNFSRASVFELLIFYVNFVDWFANILGLPVIHKYIL